MSIIKHVTLQKIVAHDFRYDPRTYVWLLCGYSHNPYILQVRGVMAFKHLLNVYGEQNETATCRT